MKRSPIRKVNAARRRGLFERAFESKARVDWLQGQGCCVCGQLPSEAAHVRSRGAGGTADDLVALCAYCHRLQHDMGIETFQATTGVDLTAEAARMTARWLARDR